MFKDNVATDNNGGAIDSGSSVNVSDSEFKGNHAYFGGAIFTENNTNIVNSIFQHNHCEDYQFNSPEGGDIYCKGSVNASNSDFSYSFSCFNGDFIWVEKFVSLNNCSFKINNMDFHGSNSIYCKGSGVINNTIFNDMDYANYVVYCSDNLVINNSRALSNSIWVALYAFIAVL